MEIKTFSNLPFTVKATFQDLQNEVKNFDFISTLMSLQKLSALMSNQIWVNINLEFEFHTGPKVKHQILLSKDFISFLAKQAILVCSESDKKYNDLDLANLVYKYGNLQIDLDYIKPNSKDGWLWILRATNHQWFYYRIPSLIIGRYVHLFKKVFEEKKHLKKSADQTLKIDFFNLLKIGTCIFANFPPVGDRGFVPSFEISNYTNTKIKELRPLLTEDNINKFLSIFAIDREGFKERNKEFKLEDQLLKKYEFNPLKRYPVIKTNSAKENEKYIIPSLSDFLYACSEGVYYVLLDKLEESSKKELFQALGDVFEKYIGELIKYYNVDIFFRAQLLAEQTYKVGKDIVKSADWLLTSDQFIFQIECKKRKLNNYSKAGIEDKHKMGINSFLKSIAQELDKFPKKEQHIKNGLIDKINYKNQKIINIIVYLDEMFALNQYARDEIKKNMKNKTDNFYILGCYEFETLCQHSKDKNVNLERALKDLIAERTEIYSIEFLHNIYLDFFDSFIRKK